MKKSGMPRKQKMQPFEAMASEEPGPGAFRPYDEATFCVYSASGLADRFVELHGDRAIAQAEYFLELAINSQDQCQIETWTYLISILEPVSTS